MTKRTVATVFPDSASASRAVHALHSVDIPGSAVSLLSSAGTLESMAPGEGKAVERGTAVGAGVGSLLSTLAMAATLPIPGGFLVAGPFGALMVSAAGGAVGGGSIGALVGLGFDDATAQGFDERIREGGVGIAVETETSDRAAQVASVLQKEGDERAGALLITTRPRP